MLRELYVAVTRAQRRVVILIKDDLPAMAQFFKELNCEVEVASEAVFREFDRDTTTEHWFSRAQKLYSDYNFSLASSCFIRAQRLDWSFLSLGRHLLDLGLKEEAEKEFRRAARLFYEGHQFQDVLDILHRLLQKNNIGAWDSADDKIFSGAIDALPHAIPRTEVIRYAILRADFSSILVTDLKSHYVAKLLITYRKECWLKKLIAQCSDNDRDEVARVIPMAVYDFYISKSNHYEACRIALSAGEYVAADVSTVAFLNDAKKVDNLDSIVRMADMWNEDFRHQCSLSPRNTSVLLKKLFQSPKLLPADLKLACTSVLGKQIVLLAVDRASLDRTILVQFSPTEFREEVELLLLSSFGPDLLKVVKWYGSNGHPTLASQFVRDRLQEWSNENLLRITKDLLIRPTWLFGELRRRRLLEASVSFVMLSPFVGETNKKQFWENYLVFGVGNPDRQNIDICKALNQCEEDSERVFALMTDRQQLLEKAFVQLWMDSDIKAAIRFSWDALSTHELATSNITSVLRLWTEMQQLNKSQVAQLAQFSTATFEDKCSFLMCLYWGDHPTENWCSVHLGMPDPYFSLLHVFGPTAAAYCKMHSSKESQDEGLCRRLTKFQAELRSQLRTRRHEFAEIYGHEESEGVNVAEAKSPNETKPLFGHEESEGVNVAEAKSTNETKPLSKSAARKLKKQQSKNAGLATTDAASNSGKNYKQANKKSNKKNNKKKKGKR